jgi:hypothetical protein
LGSVRVNVSPTLRERQIQPKGLLLDRWKCTPQQSGDFIAGKSFFDQKLELLNLGISPRSLARAHFFTLNSVS